MIVQYNIIVVLLLAAQTVSQELNSTLHSTLYGISIAYVDEMVVFTCVVRGSNSMAWTSEEYIGTGGRRLEMSAAELVGTRYSIPVIGNDLLLNLSVPELMKSLHLNYISGSNPTIQVHQYSVITSMLVQ